MAADIEQLLATRHSDLTRSRLQLDIVSEMCRSLLEPWPNRDSSGVRVTTSSATDCARGSEGHSPPGGIEEGGHKEEAPLQSGHEGTGPLNRGSMGESPLRSCSSPELAIDMAGLEEILTKARKVRETQTKLEGKQSRSKPDVLKSIKGEPSKTTARSNMQRAAQVYAKQSRQTKPHSAAVQSKSQISQSRVQPSKKMPGSTDLKSKSCHSQLHSMRKPGESLNDVHQRRTQVTASVGGKGLHGGGGGKAKAKARPEWCSVAPSGLVRSEEDEVVDPCASHLPGGDGGQGPAYKEAGLAMKEDKMKGHFRISESGRNLDMPLKYHRLKKAAARVTAELDAHQGAYSSSYGEAFAAKLSQLDDMDQQSTADADVFIRLLLFREDCRTLQSQMQQCMPQKKVTDQSLSQRKRLPTPDPQSVKLRFTELEGQWAELSSRGCALSVDRWSVPWDSMVREQPCKQPQPLVYSSVKEWLEYSQLKYEVAQLEWEVKFLKACLTVILPKLKHTTSDRSHIHTIQSVYRLFGITQPSFVILHGCST